ncbi:hypothetical protein [Streptomyces mirabilis]|uniref:hypothetical protein n=1 Tax=Streptomyces mirabilis TaxID=68239 RepID=UPI00368181F2
MTPPTPSWRSCVPPAAPNVLAELTLQEQDLHRRSLHRLRASAALHFYLEYLGKAA